MGSLGNWTQTAYNGYGYVSSTTNALGWTSLTATNARGLVTSSVGLDKRGEYRERLLQKQAEVLQLAALKNQQEYLRMVNLVSNPGKG